MPAGTVGIPREIRSQSLIAQDLIAQDTACVNI